MGTWTYAHPREPERQPVAGCLDYPGTEVWVGSCDGASLHVGVRAQGVTRSIHVPAGQVVGMIAAAVRYCDVDPRELLLALRDALDWVDDLDLTWEQVMRHFHALDEAAVTDTPPERH